MLGVLEGLLKVFAVLISKPKLFNITAHIIILIILVYLYTLQTQSKDELTSIKNTVDQRKTGKLVENKRFKSSMREVVNLLKNCNNQTEGENCFLSFYEIAYIESSYTDYLLKIELLTKGFINEYTSQYEEKQYIIWYTEGNDKKNYKLPNSLKYQILESGRCGTFETTELPKSHPFRDIIQDQSIKLGKGAFCLGGCTVTLTQSTGHKANCKTPYCDLELANLYYAYFDKDSCYMDLRLVNEKT